MPHHVGSFSLPSELLQRLATEATRQSRPISWLVRDALLQYLASQQDADAREEGRNA